MKEGEWGEKEEGGRVTEGRKVCIMHVDTCSPRREDGLVLS